MENDMLKDAENKMKITCDKLSEEYSAIRSGKPSIAIFESIELNSRNGTVKLKNCSYMKLADNFCIITLSDPKLAQEASNKILSIIGLQSVADGNTLKVEFTPMTMETKNKYSKWAAEKAEEAKAAIRRHRQVALQSISSDPSKNNQELNKKKLQNLVDKMTKHISDTLNKKVKDILSV